MRIGIDARVLYAPQLKGIGRYLQHLLDHLVLADGGHEYLLFYDEGSAVVDRTPRHPGVKAVPVEARSEELWEQWALPRMARRLDVDLFHSPANTTMCWAPCPVVVTLHDADSHRMAAQWGRRAQWYWNGLQRWAYRRTRRFIAPSAFGKQQLMQCLQIPGQRIRVVPHGIAARYHRTDPATVSAWMARYDLHQPYLFTAGARSARKNIPSLLRAFDQVARQRPGVTLVVSGVAGVRDVEAVRSQLANRQRIRCVPHLEEPELIAAYSGAEVFVFPSLNETFGFPPLEAMACGAPVVASNATCMPEVLGDAAFLVDCTRPEPLAEAILKVLGDPALQAQLVERGLARARQFRWEQAARETLAVYEEAVGG